MQKKTTDRQLKSWLRSGKASKHAIGNGLYFRVSPQGTGTWVIRYLLNKKRREITLGKYPDLSLVDASAEAVLQQKGIKSNVDPLVERHRAYNDAMKVVDELAEDWLSDCSRRLKYPNIPKRIYEKDISPSIGQIPIDQVTPLDVRECIRKITKSGRPSIANDALLYCKQLFRHGIKLNLLQNNPAEAFTVNDAGGIEKSRSRFLSLEEISKIFVSFNTHRGQFARENSLAVALLISLGVRKGELIGAVWSEIDSKSKLWTIPKNRSKNGLAIAIPLSAEVLEWFRELHVRACGSPYVFPKRRASKRNDHISPDTLNAAIQKLHREKKLAVDHFTVHDFRRTCRSLLASEGVSGHVAERCLNHKLKGVEGIYDRYDYLDERREALQKIAKRISPFVSEVEAF